MSGAFETEWRRRGREAAGRLIGSGEDRRRLASVFAAEQLAGGEITSRHANQLAAEISAAMSLWSEELGHPREWHWLTRHTDFADETIKGPSGSLNVARYQAWTALDPDSESGAERLHDAACILGSRWSQSVENGPYRGLYGGLWTRLRAQSETLYQRALGAVLAEQLAKLSGYDHSQLLNQLRGEFKGAHVGRAQPADRLVGIHVLSLLDLSGGWSCLARIATDQQLLVSRVLKAGKGPGTWKQVPEDVRRECWSPYLWGLLEAPLERRNAGSGADHGKRWNTPPSPPSQSLAVQPGNLAQILRVIEEPSRQHTRLQRLRCVTADQTVEFEDTLSFLASALALTRRTEDRPDVNALSQSEALIMELQVWRNDWSQGVDWTEHHRAQSLTEQVLRSWTQGWRELSSAEVWERTWNWARQRGEEGQWILGLAVIYSADYAHTWWLLERCRKASSEASRWELARQLSGRMRAQLELGLGVNDEMSGLVWAHAARLSGPSLLDHPDFTGCWIEPIKAYGQLQYSGRHG